MCINFYIYILYILYIIYKYKVTSFILVILRKVNVMMLRCYVVTMILLYSLTFSFKKPPTTWEVVPSISAVWEWNMPCEWWWYCWMLPTRKSRNLMNYFSNGEAPSIGCTLQLGLVIIAERLGLYWSEELSPPAGGG